MGGAFVEFIPMMIGAAIVPLWITLVLLLLRSQGGFSKAIAFAGGQVLVRLAQGFIFRNASVSSAVVETKERASIIVSTLFLVAGILLWITALKIWNKEEDPDAPPPKWMAMCDSISALKTFGFSILLITVSAKQWVFTLGALSVIREADLPGLNSALAFLIYVLGAQSLVLMPIVVYAVTPRHSPRLLEASIQWLERNNQTIMILVSVLFGTYFISKGITRLRG